MDATKKTIVGLFVAGTLLLFAVGLFLIGDSTQLFAKSFEVSTDFLKVTGLEIGTKVRVAGMDAGAVTVIDIPPQPGAKFRVRIRISEKLHSLVRQDSVATIQTDGVLGNKFMEVDAGSEASARAQNGSAIRSKEPFDWGDLMTQVSDSVKSVSTIIAGLKEPVIAAVGNISETASSANLLIKKATPQVQSILEASGKVADNIREMTQGVKEGHGVVGALLHDEDLARNVKQAVVDTHQTIQNVRDTTESAKKLVAKIDDSQIVPEVRQAATNLRHITDQVKSAVDKFQSSSADGGVAENLQRTLADAHEAMSDLSDDTEALKHNFLFRGFFRNRGFYDLGSMSAADYKAGKLGKGFQQHRMWLETADLFGKDAKGAEVISPVGKQALDDAMTQILQFPRNGALIVEGYTGEGNASMQYLEARRRAVLVQSYITYRFHLRPAYVGIVAMGAVPKDPGSGAGFREGIGIVSFYKK